MRNPYFVRVITLLVASPTLGAAAKEPSPSAQENSAVESSDALEKYVAKPDSSFQWKKRREGTLGQGKYVELTLASQTWRDITWKHQLFIYRPAAVDSTQALLLIGGGSWNESLEQPPGEANGELPHEAHLVAAIADALHAPVAVVLQVPEQPLFGGMVEDEIISHTFAKYMESSDPEWPLLLPMVKSVVRAMDAVEEFAAADWQLKIEHFLVTGASKRGWTTWLTAAVDPRVNALAPMVIDMLNMQAHMKLQRQSFGEYSEQIRDYTDKGLQNYLDTDRGVALRAIVDPFSYRHQLQQPKLIILGTNDRYWPVDSLNLYWDQLEGEKYILYVPNNGHGLRDHARIVGTVAALHQRVTGGKPLPKLTWKFDEQSDALNLQLSSDIRPAVVTAWTAAAESRDFRQAEWTGQRVEASANGGEFVVEMPKPKSGFAAIFAEAKFAGRSIPYYLSTNLRVVDGTAAQPSAVGR